MSIFQRIAIILKSYARTAEDRFDRIAHEEEMREAKSRKQAIEELRNDDFLASISSSGVLPQQQSAQSRLSDRLIADYRYLGIEPGAGLDKVETAWRNLASRADPKRFPSGSEEEKKAAEILKSLNESYERIRETLHPVEGRFGQLEL